MTASDPWDVLKAADFDETGTWSRTALEARTRAAGQCYVMEPWGILIARRVLDEAEIIDLYVAPNARRRGIARRLMERFETELIGTNVRRGYLEVSRENTAARALYESLGWASIGRRVRYYRLADGRRVDAISMAKTLD